MVCCRKTIRETNGQIADVYKGESFPLRLTIHDRVDNAIVDPATLDSLTLTLLTEAGDVVNGVDATDIKNVDRGHFNADLSITVTIREADTLAVADNSVLVVQIKASWTTQETQETHVEFVEQQALVYVVLSAV